MRPYANKLTELLVNLSSALDNSEEGVYSKNRELKKVLFVTITSNRGLCGGFNINIIKKAKSLIEDEYNHVEVEFLSIGKKSSEHFTKNNYTVVSTHDDLYSDLTFRNTSEIVSIYNGFIFK